MTSTPKITLTKDEQLRAAIAQADEMAIKMQGQINRQKAGLDRLIEERQAVIELLQLSLGHPSSEEYVRKALSTMHVAKRV